MSFQSSYESVYGVGLLDDLHNYFPEILYNPQRFETVGSLLYYIQRQTASRFNLFQRGRASYTQQTVEEFPFRSASMPPPAPPTTRFRVSPLYGSAAPAATSMRVTEDILLSPLLSLLRASALPAWGPRAAGGFEDVTVRPTTAQITAATRLLTGPPGNQPAAVCAICQDSISSTDACRQLLACRHAFHQGCIDPWFQQNVRCPICRHDVRILPTSDAPAPSATSSTVETPSETNTDGVQ